MAEKKTECKTTKGEKHKKNYKKMKPYIQSGNRSGVLLQLWSMNGIKIRLVAYLYVKSTRTR